MAVKARRRRKPAGAVGAATRASGEAAGGGQVIAVGDDTVLRGPVSSRIAGAAFVAALAADAKANPGEPLLEEVSSYLQHIAQTLLSRCPGPRRREDLVAAVSPILLGNSWAQSRIDQLCSTCWQAVCRAAARAAANGTEEQVAAKDMQFSQAVNHAREVLANCAAKELAQEEERAELQERRRRRQKEKRHREKEQREKKRGNEMQREEEEEDEEAEEEEEEENDGASLLNSDAAIPSEEGIADSLVLMRGPQSTQGAEPAEAEGLAHSLPDSQWTVVHRVRERKQGQKPHDSSKQSVDSRAKGGRRGDHASKSGAKDISIADADSSRLKLHTVAAVAAQSGENDDRDEENDEDVEEGGAIGRLESLDSALFRNDDEPTPIPGDGGDELVGELGPSREGSSDRDEANEDLGPSAEGSTDRALAGAIHQGKRVVAANVKTLAADVLSELEREGASRKGLKWIVKNYTQGQEVTFDVSETPSGHIGSIKIVDRAAPENECKRRSGVSSGGSRERDRSKVSVQEDKSSFVSMTFSLTTTGEEVCSLQRATSGGTPPILANDDAVSDRGIADDFGADMAMSAATAQDRGASAATSGDSVGEATDDFLQQDFRAPASAAPSHSSAAVADLRASEGYSLTDSVAAASSSPCSAFARSSRRPGSPSGSGRGSFSRLPSAAGSESAGSAFDSVAAQSAPSDLDTSSAVAHHPMARSLSEPFKAIRRPGEPFAGYSVPSPSSAKRKPPVGHLPPSIPRPSGDASTENGMPRASFGASSSSRLPPGLSFPPAVDKGKLLVGEIEGASLFNRQISAETFSTDHEAAETPAVLWPQTPELLPFASPGLGPNPAMFNRFAQPSTSLSRGSGPDAAPRSLQGAGAPEVVYVPVMVPHKCTHCGHDCEAAVDVPLVPPVSQWGAPLAVPPFSLWEPPSSVPPLSQWEAPSAVARDAGAHPPSPCCLSRNSSGTASSALSSQARRPDPFGNGRPAVVVEPPQCTSPLMLPMPSTHPPGSPCESRHSS